VWTVDTDAKGATTAKIQPVKIALAQGQVTILDSGIEAGQKVVVDGADRLRQGAPVVATQARQAGAGQGARNAGGQAPASDNGPLTGKHPHKEQQ
jgi:multidrug efflux system membrane fusion protein